MNVNGNKIIQDRSQIHSRWFVHHTHANVEMFINLNYLHMIKWPPTNKNTTPHNDAAVMLDFPQRLPQLLRLAAKKSLTMDPVQTKTNRWGITSSIQTWQWEIIHGRVNGKSICKWALFVDCHWLPCWLAKGIWYLHHPLWKKLANPLLSRCHWGDPLNTWKPKIPVLLSH